HKVEERFAHRALMRGRECPAVLVRPRPVDLAERPAGQVLEAAVAEERIALEIEEHVAPRRFRQPHEAALGLDGQWLERRQRMVPRLDLELRLPGEAYVRLWRSPMRLCRERAAGHRQIDDRADALALEV